jgi:hypothetical protein
VLDGGALRAIRRASVHYTDQIPSIHAVFRTKDTPLYIEGI